MPRALPRVERAQLLGATDGASAAAAIHARSNEPREQRWDFAIRSSFSYCSGESRNSMRAVHLGDGPGFRASSERGLRFFRTG